MSNTFLDVEQKVYNARNINRGSYYETCVKHDLITPMQGTLKQLGFYLHYDGIYRKLGSVVGVDTPWQHVRHLKQKRCGIDHNVKFTCFGYVPPRCMECWKVVVSPRTLKELFLLLEVEKSLERASKCGIEVRYYTPRLYGGYFYNNSLDEGRHRYEEVRKAVDEHIGKDVPVILKRACTEYEMIMGPSAGWVMNAHQHWIDDQLESMIDMTAPNSTGQTEACISQVHTHWMEWAWKHQDPTVKEYIGDLPLYPETMKYHEHDPEAIKAEISNARAKVKFNIEPEVSNALRATAFGFRMTKGILPHMLGTIWGYDAISPLYRGEHDELL
jgi:hypothetical protein